MVLERTESQGCSSPFLQTARLVHHGMPQRVAETIFAGLSRLCFDLLCRTGRSAGGRRCSRGKRACAGDRVSSSASRRAGPTGAFFGCVSGTSTRRLKDCRKRKSLLRKTAISITCWGWWKPARAAPPRLSPTFEKRSNSIQKNLIATYQLAEEIERQGDTNSDAEFQKLMQQIVDAQPKMSPRYWNWAASRRNVETSLPLRQVVEALRANLSPGRRKSSNSLTRCSRPPLDRSRGAAALRTTYLRNVLMRLPDFRKDLGRDQAAAWR